MRILNIEIALFLNKNTPQKVGYVLKESKNNYHTLPVIPFNLIFFALRTCALLGTCIILIQANTIKNAFRKHDFML